MSSPISYATGFFTLTEDVFNIMGYLPKNQFPNYHKWGVTWRKNQGILQLITGVALISLGYLADYAFPNLATNSYLSMPLQAVSLGLLFANHGAFNIVRSYIEKVNIPGVTLLYDFYGQKALPAMNPKYDILNELFSKVKNLMDQLVFISFFPPQLIFK